MAETDTTPPEGLDRARIVGLMVADLIRPCPECGGSGAPTVAEGPSGAFALECDCTGFGYYVTPEAVDMFRIAESVLESFPWHASVHGRHAALGAFLIQWCSVVRAPDDLPRDPRRIRYPHYHRDELDGERVVDLRPRNENYAEPTDQEKQWTGPGNAAP